ncbi:MAG: OmpW/AlkL family protein [Methylocystis sp.]
MKQIVRGAVAAIAMGASAVSASAADLATKKAPLIEDDFHPFQVRMLVSSVVPLAGTANIYDRGNGTYMPGLTAYNLLQPNQTALQATGYSLGAGSLFNGAGTTISWSVMPTLSLGYYFNKNWSVEAICCVSPHHVQGTGSINGGSVIKTWVFPPTLTLVYHFTNFGAFQPYLGAGVNFTAYWGTRAGNQPFQIPLSATVVPNTVGAYTATGATITPSWGVAAQAGMDYMINKEWGWNLDAKWILMEPNAHVYGTYTSNAGSTLGLPQYNALSIPLNLGVKINPIVISTGLTYRFGSGKSQPALAQKVGGFLPQF